MPSDEEKSLYPGTMTNASVPTQDTTALSKYQTNLGGVTSNFTSKTHQSQLSQNRKTVYVKQREDTCESALEKSDSKHLLIEESRESLKLIPKTTTVQMSNATSTQDVLTSRDTDNNFTTNLNKLRKEVDFMGNFVGEKV